MNIIMLDSMYCSFVQITEKVVKLMIDFSHQCLTFVGVNIMIKIDIAVITAINLLVVITGMRYPEVAFVGVFRHWQVSLMLPVRMCVLNPIVWSVLDSMHVVVFINMLRMMLTIITIRVVVSHVMSSLWLNVVIFTVFLSREVAIVVKMRLVVLQVPVTLLKMGIRVMFITVH